MPMKTKFVSRSRALNGPGRAAPIHDLMRAEIASEPQRPRQAESAIQVQPTWVEGRGEPLLVRDEDTFDFDCRRPASEQFFVPSLRRKI